MVFVSETDDMPLSPFLSCTDGIIRTRYRDSTSTPSLVEPGRAYGYTIDLWATSNVFKAQTSPCPPLHPWALEPTFPSGKGRGEGDPHSFDKSLFICRLLLHANFW